MKFTIEEIKNYIVSQESRGDILYNLSEENIQKAQPSGYPNEEYADEAEWDDDIMTIEEYNDHVEFGAFLYHDGFFHYAVKVDDTYFRDNEFHTGRATSEGEATHVIWYNK